MDGGKERQEQQNQQGQQRQGLQGLQGLQGSQDTQDSQGSQGSQGLQGSQGSGYLNEAFKIFSQFSDKNSDGKSISLQSIIMWLEQANVLGGKFNITKEDVSNAFSKTTKSKDSMDPNQFSQFVDQLAQDKKVDPKEITDQLVNARPGMGSVFGSGAGLGSEEQSQGQENRQGGATGFFQDMKDSFKGAKK